MGKTAAWDGAVVLAAPLLVSCWPVAWAKQGRMPEHLGFFTHKADLGEDRGVCAWSGPALVGKAIWGVMKQGNNLSLPLSLCNSAFCISESLKEQLQIIEVTE